MHAIEKYIERREREKGEREREKVGFSPIGEREEEGVLTMAFQGSFPYRQIPTTYPGLSQAGRSHYLTQGYSKNSYYNPPYAQQQSGQYTSYHQPFGSAQQPMGNPRPTPFTSSPPRAVTPPSIVPPLAPTVDLVMSALAQMMSKLIEVSDRLDRVERAKAQCSDPSAYQRKGKRVEFADKIPSQLMNIMWPISQSHFHVSFLC